MQNLIMTPTHTETPLRRSEIRVFRTPVQQAPVLNDDEEERRQRRRTAYEESTTSNTIEDNETLKNCIKICNENKLSKENAWSVSVIDALSKLLDKHHKSFTNFKVAGSSLEASSKVYGLRVDSIHTDVLRLSAGLNKRKFTEKNDENDEENLNSQDNNGNNVQKDDGNDKEQQKIKYKRRKKNLLSTVTKNKETINAKLDTHPFTDPIFAKLNSIGGSINSSGRLLQNILPSIDSEIMLKMDYQFWDSTVSSSENYDILEDNNTEEQNNLLLKEYESITEVTDFDVLETINLDDLKLRTIHNGYKICDTPVENDDENDCVDNRKDSEAPLNADNDEKNESQLAMAFDINAEIEPVQTDGPGFMDVDMGELDDLTVEEQVAITNCRALRRKPVIIEDMRPVDSTSSKLEYSYRPLDKISQFWAGPSHWKFKRTTRNSYMTIHQKYESQISGTAGRTIEIRTKVQNCKSANNRGRLKRALARDKEIILGDVNEDLFLNIDHEISRKLRKVNIQKKWDAKKLKLPTDLRINSDIFDTYQYAPGLKVIRNRNRIDTDDDDYDENITSDMPATIAYNYDNSIDPNYVSNLQNVDDLINIDRDVPMTQGTEMLPSQAIVEIATDFLGAPDKVTRIIVPFARRAKVIDMKQLKKCCLHLIKNQIITTNKENLPEDLVQDIHDNTNNNNNNINNNNNKNILKNEKYKKGYTTFTQIYKELPKMLSSNMKESLSPSIAFYSILHLANETNLRLIPQDNSTGFKILQLEN